MAKNIIMYSIVEYDQEYIIMYSIVEYGQEYYYVFYS